MVVYASILYNTQFTFTWQVAYTWASVGNSDFFARDWWFQFLDNVTIANNFPWWFLYTHTIPVVIDIKAPIFLWA